METRTLTITVPASEARSVLWVGRGLLPTLGSLLEVTKYSQVIVVGDQGVRSLVNQVAQVLECGESHTLEIQGGEACKTLSCVEQLWRFFASVKLDRRSLVVGVGGGALSDSVGFAAATYMRGVAYANVPTTLLAQVDAGIGGKSGINLCGVKNLVGSITQPIGIVIDLDTLASLPTREVRSGFAEIVKHGLIADNNYFNLVSSRPCTDWSADELVDIVFRSCQIKCSIVESDISEQGLRKAINFGHSLGHAVEAYAIDSAVQLSHGEAVAIGMNAACFISNRVGLLSREQQQRCIEGIRRAGLPLVAPVPMDAKKLLNLLSLDKKNIGGIPRWTLLTEIGACVINQQVPEAIVREAIAHIQPPA